MKPKALFDLEDIFTDHDTNAAVRNISQERPPIDLTVSGVTTAASKHSTNGSKTFDHKADFVSLNSNPLQLQADPRLANASPMLREEIALFKAKKGTYAPRDTFLSAMYTTLNEMNNQTMRVRSSLGGLEQQVGDRIKQPSPQDPRHKELMAQFLQVKQVTITVHTAISKMRGPVIEEKRQEEKKNEGKSIQEAKKQAAKLQLKQKQPAVKAEQEQGSVDSLSPPQSEPSSALSRCRATSMLRRLRSCVGIRSLPLSTATSVWKRRRRTEDGR
jgi:hypothetical protein